MTAGSIPPDPSAPASAPAGRLWFFFALALVACVHIAAFSTLPPGVFWSPDEGAKFIQMRSLDGSGDGSGHPAYAGKTGDPLYVFYPPGHIYPRPVWPAGARRNWPNTFPALSLPLFHAFGPAGLYGIPLGGGILAAAFAGLLARRLAPAAAVPAILMAGLASPLLFLSMLFMEHTLAAALALGALCCVMAVGYGRAPGFTGAAASVFAAAALPALRDETLLLLAAAAIAALPWAPSRGKRALLLAALLLPAALSALLAARSATAASGTPAAAVQALRGLATLDLWRELPSHLIRVLVNNPDRSGVPMAVEWAAAGLAGLGLCAFAPLARKRLRLPCWLAGAALAGLVSTIGLATPDRYRAVHGLLLPMPALVLAWLPATANPGIGPSRAERFMRTTLTAFLVLFCLATWIARRPDGGPEWGARYALPAYLLAAILGAAALTRRLTRGGLAARLAAGGAALALLALSLAHGVRGIVEIQVTKRDLAAFDAELAANPVPVVAEPWWLAAALAPRFVESPLYTLNPQAGLDQWMDRIGRRSRAFLHVSYRPPPDVLALPDGRSAVLVRRREIQNMIFSEFAVR